MRVPFTDVSYERPERITDCIVGRWLLVVVLPLVAAALLAPLLDMDVLGVAAVLELLAVTAFATSSASHPTRDRDGADRRHPVRVVLQATFVVAVATLLVSGLVLSG